MEECVILSDGDKIKELRKKYGLKQEEIAGQEITRNLISEIETNKANITKKTAEVIIKNLNVLSKKRNFEFTETVEYLMENQAVQANKVLDNYIEELKTLSISKDDSFIKTLKEAESFLIDWDIKDKKLSIYELAGDYYCNNNEMYQSAVYYEKASALLSRMFLDKELLPLSRKLSMVYGYIGDYKKSIECCEFALSHFDDMPREYIVVFRFNKCLNYINTNKFELALKEIEVAEKLVDKNDVSKYVSILNNKGICLYKIKNYIEALKVFSQTLMLISKDDIDGYLIGLINVVNSYLSLDMKDKAVENFDILIKNLHNIDDDSSYISDIYFEVGKIYKRFDKIDLSEECCLKALGFCESQKNYVLANDILYNLAELYKITNNVEKMNNIKNKFFSISNNQGKISNDIMYRLIDFYSDNAIIIKELSAFALQINHK